MFSRNKTKGNQSIASATNDHNDTKLLDVRARALLSSNRGDLSSMGTTAEDSYRALKSLSFREKIKLRKQMKKQNLENDKTPSFPIPISTTKNDDGEIMLNTNTVAIMEKIEQLQLENEVLLSKCQKLEAQNVIAAAQTVDFLSVILGLVSCLLTWLVYGRMFFSVVDYTDLNYFAGSSMIVKGLILAIPWIYNKFNYGVIYRRFQVFAVFTIFVIRVKLVRWRAQKFAKAKDDGKDFRANGSESSSTPTSSTPHFGGHISEDDIWEANFEINARYLYSSIVRLRGLWTKTAQYLSSRADFVPTSYVRELSKLQDEAPETPWEEVKLMLSKAGIIQHSDYGIIAIGSPFNDDNGTDSGTVTKASVQINATTLILQCNLVLR